MLATVGVLSGSVATSAVAEAPGVVGRYSTVESAQPLLDSTTYLSIVRGMLANREHFEQSDAVLIQGAKDLCAEIDAGATWQTFTDQVEQYDGDIAFYRVTIRASVLAYCPQHEGILP